MSEPADRAAGRVLSVNVGRARMAENNGRPEPTAIWKHPVAGRVAVRGVNVDGDEQADLEAHGGPDQAVYAYAREDYEWWERELGRELEPGAFGENLTLAGIEVSRARVGERWRIGTTLLEVTKPRLPCWKLERRLGLDRFIKRFGDAGRYGAYLRIVEEGELGVGDRVEVQLTIAAALTVRDVGRAKLKREAEEEAKLGS